jgi:hypothetical protein
MFSTRLFRPSRHRPLIWCIVLTLLFVQGLRMHFHTFVDHEPLHGHGHALELHIGGMVADSGHDDPDSETALDKFALLKLKRVHTDATALALIAALPLLILVLVGRGLRPPGRLRHPSPGGHVRTPPLRAPPL